MNETISLGGHAVTGFGAAPGTLTTGGTLWMFPAGSAVIGGLIGYAVKRNARGVAVGAAVGAAAPFALTAVIIAAGWRP